MVRYNGKTVTGLQKINGKKGGGGLWRFLNKMEKDTDKAHNMITPKCQDKEYARVEIKQQIVQYNL